MKYLDLSNLRGDIYGGITAGVVALPLALAFGEASGAGPMAGLWGAIFVGFFAALFGGTGSQISGPTGPIVVVFAGVFASLSGNPALVFAAVVLAGLMQIVLGIMRIGDYIRLVPYPVISGFMTGIGCIIIALQLARLFGHEPQGGGTIPALTAVPAAIADPNLGALAIGVLTLVMIFSWPTSWSRYIPGPLAALVVATVAGTFLTNIPVLGDIPTGWPTFILPAFSQDTLSIVLEAALILALLGAIDSLLTSLVADNMTRTRHNSNRELIGQGVGNTIAGLFGAIPGAGATMRTVVNIRTGGRTPISGMLHAMVLLAVVVSLGPLAAKIPHAALAGILVKVGYDIIDFAYLRRAHVGPYWDLLLMALVLGLTFFVDLITAVAVGVVLATLAFVKRLADDQLNRLQHEDMASLTEEEEHLLKEVPDRITLFELHGPLSFGAAADMGHHVRERVKEKFYLILDFAGVAFVDVSAVRAVETLIDDAHAAGKKVFVSNVDEKVENTIAGLTRKDWVPADRMFRSRLEALRTAVALIKESPEDHAGEEEPDAPTG